MGTQGRLTAVVLLIATFLAAPVCGETLQAESSTVVPRSGEKTTKGDPGCEDGTCREVCVSGLPVGSSIVAVEAYAKEQGSGSWAGCWPHSGGGNFLDCGIQGWFRFLGRTHSTNTSSSGLRVCWTAINWSHDRNREARIVVKYNPPR